MTGAAVEIRRLSSRDTVIYREIRLEALRLEPEAFSSTLAAERPQFLAWFAARLDSAAVFGAFSGGALVGIAGFLAKPGQKEAHKGVLVGMYVQQGARGAGVGRRLAEAVIEYARTRVEILQVTVVSSNQPARQLYRKLGFVEYGIEKNALKAGECYWDDVLMAKSLSSTEPAPL
jgi:ribosomal protein S18 acetylase RimI-like enzyme